MVKREPFIVHQITPDGLLGWNKYGQLMVGWRDYPQKEGEDDEYGISYTHTWNYVGEKCEICGQEFKLSATEWREIRRLEDFGNVHGHCLRSFQTLREKYDWDSLLQKIRIRYCGLERLPNQYSLGEWGPDWFKCQLYERTPYITIGRRKRVWELTLHDAAVTREEYKGSLLDDATETATKEYAPERVMIHAWNHEQAERYLRCFWEWSQKESLVDLSKKPDC